MDTAGLAGTAGTEDKTTPTGLSAGAGAGRPLLVFVSKHPVNGYHWFIHSHTNQWHYIFETYEFGTC